MINLLLHSFNNTFEIFYKDLFNVGNGSYREEEIELISRLVSDEMNKVLLKEVSMVEVKKATFDMGAKKALVPNGLTGLFYHQNWEVVGSDIFDAVKVFFNSGIMPAEINETHIALVQKMEASEELGHSSE